MKRPINSWQRGVAPGAGCGGQRAAAPACETFHHLLPDPQSPGGRGGSPSSSL